MVRPNGGFLWTLAALGLAQGCLVHRVRVESEPAGARVELDGRFKGTTPTEFRVFYTPPLTRDYDIAVMLPNYRTVESTGDGLCTPRRSAKRCGCGATPCTRFSYERSSA
ncbi:MAG: PEGA domain-containing protein [Deltaproteobacteria bacterium]|nr:PEGA domain-containing protein [Deltaproteobacteria bacterium]